MHLPHSVVNPGCCYQPSGVAEGVSPVGKASSTAACGWPKQLFAPGGLGHLAMARFASQVSCSSLLHLELRSSKTSRLISSRSPCSSEEASSRASRWESLLAAVLSIAAAQKAHHGWLSCKLLGTQVSQGLPACCGVLSEAREQNFARAPKVLCIWQS